MKVQKSLFTFNDSWPWLLITLFVAGINVAAFRHNWTLDWSGDVGYQLSIMALVSLVFLALTTYRYHLREGFIWAWNHAYQTTTGVAVMVEDTALVLMIKAGIVKGSTDNTFNDKISDLIESAVVYWAHWYQTYAPAPGIVKLVFSEAAAGSKMRDALSGQSLEVVSKPPVDSIIGKLAGYEDGLNIVVTFDGTGIASEAALLGLIRHEVSHVCLSAVGIDAGYAGTKHHEIFAQTGYC